MSSRRKFSALFKAEAVQIVIDSGRPLADLTRDLGIHDGTLRNGQQLPAGIRSLISR